MSAKTLDIVCLDSPEGQANLARPPSEVSRATQVLAQCQRREACVGHVCEKTVEVLTDDIAS